MQTISTDKSVRRKSVQDLKAFNSHTLATQAKKREQLVSIMPAMKKTFDLMGDDTGELSTENESLKKVLGPYDGNWLEESKAKILKQFDDEKRANLIRSRTEKQMRKQY